MSGAIDFKAKLTKAVLTVKKLKAKLEQVESAKHEPIAIVGMGCRFPGGARDEASFLQVLRDGTDTISDFPRDRANADRWYDPNPEAIGKAYIMKAGYLDKIDGFDPTLFGITPREAVGMDPQQRLALEVALEALENAGIAGDSLGGSRTGVYVGASTNDYVRLRQQYGLPEDVDAYNMVGEQSFIAGRISYTFGLHGPAEMIDTACSSSLVSTHLAVQSLRRGETDLCLAGGVNLIMSPFGYVLLSKTSAISPNGRCATFDAKADGYTRGEGCGFIVLKRLADAVTDGDNILALVRGTAVNHDGKSSGLTVPNNAAQQAVIRDALADAKCEAHDVSFIEAHGTGTSLGDPIELRALEAVVGAGRGDDNRLKIGSVKTNFGHLEAAAGIAGLLKLVVSLRSKFIPPHLHFTTPNPNVNWKQLHIDVVTEGQAWDDATKVAGVSSFGASGTNSHIILSQAPERASSDGTSRAQHILTLSAKTDAALAELAGRVGAGLGDATIEDVCFTTNTGRSRLPKRAAVVAGSIDELATDLGKLAAGKKAKGVVRGQATNRNRTKLTFLFTGQGSQTLGMGKTLYDGEPVFKAALDRCADLLKDDLPLPLLDVIWGDEATSPLHDTRYSQPALFAIEWAMAQLWGSWGVKPRSVMGHSVGEYVAAAVAGVFSLEDGLKMIAARGRLMSALPAGGAMCQIGVDEARAKALVAEHPGELSIAGINGPTDTVISGSQAAIDAVAAKLDGEQITAKKLKVSHAFHSHLMEPMLADFEKVVAAATLSAPKVALISNLTGEAADDSITTAKYWCDHIRQAVRFLPSICGLHEQGASTFLEIGPRRTLVGLGTKCLPEAECTWVASMRGKGKCHKDALLALGELYTLGVDVDWSAVHAGTGAQRIPLPSYPFQHERYWFDMYDDDEGPRVRAKKGEAPSHPLLGTQQRSPMTVFESRLEADALPWLEAHGDHRVAGTGALLEVAAAAAQAGLRAAHALEDVTISEPLVFPPADPLRLQIIANDGRFDIYSQTDAEAARALPWVHHAHGRFAPMADVAGAPGAALSSDTAGSSDATSSVSVPDEPGFGVHPTVLDDALAALATTTGLVLGAGSSAAGPARKDVAISLSRCEVRSIQPGSAYSIGGDRDGVRVLDADGNVAASLSGVKTAPFRHAALHRPRHDRLHDAMYELVWQSRAREVAAPANTGSRTVIFTDKGGSGDQLASALEAAGETVLKVPRNGDLDPASIVGDLNGADRIAFCWGLDATPPESTTVDSLLDARTWTTDFAIKLVQALVAAKLDAPPKLWLITKGAQPAGRKHGINVAASGLWGLGRVIGLEQPDVWGGMIDLDPDGTNVADVVAELVDGEGEDQVALRAEGRFAPRLIRSPHEDRPLLSFQPSSEGVYLITGGMGGLGLTVAKWLVENGATHIAITGRSEFPAHDTWTDDGHDDATKERITALSGLEALGAQVSVVQADVIDGDRMKTVIMGLNGMKGGLRGIVHAAGISRPQDIVDIDLDTFNSVLKPKVEGAWVLHELTKDLELEIFLMFSSIASVWGSQHIASYSTANHVLDALGHHRGALGIAGLSVNWGPWLVETNLADTEVLEFLEAVGLQPFEAPQGTEIMGHLIASNVPQMVVSGVDWSVFKMVYEARGERPLLEHIKVGAGGGGDGPAEKSETLLALEDAAPSERGGIVQGYLREQIADIMRMDAESVDLNSDVVELGVDSLMVMEVIKLCKRGLGVTILPKDLFERPTVAEWATYVTAEIGETHGLEAEAPAAEAKAETKKADVEASQGTPKGPDWTKPENLVPEIGLAEDVRPAPGATVERLDDPSAILLTGGTGFVGAYLLKELLKETHARIHCLVRGDDPDAAKRRLAETFAKYELDWDSQAEERVVALPADLGLPKFGLTDGDYDRLGRTMDGIFHCAAIVNFSLSYEQSKAANIVGTEEILRLACKGKLKPVHYVSTYGLWGIPDDPHTKYMEDDDILGAGKLINGYVQTKWVAEKNVYIARDRGVPVNTYRLGRVMGDTSRGIGLTTALTCAILKGCIQLGKAPKFGDHLVEMTPVDYCAQAMVHIAKEATELGTTFHLINPSRISFGELVAYMQRRGYELEVVSPRDWQAGLLATLGTESSNELHPLMDAVEEVLDNPDDAVVYDTQHVLDALSGSSIICPPIDHRLLDTYFSYFTRCGWLEEPPAKA